MATVTCPKCDHRFDPTNYPLKGGGAALGVAVGSGIGLALGPLGAIAGTIPGAIIGGSMAYLGLSKVARCPTCTKTFLL